MLYRIPMALARMLSLDPAPEPSIQGTRSQVLRGTLPPHRIVCQRRAAETPLG